MTTTAFDWKGEATKESPAAAPKIPDAPRVRVKIAKIIFGTKAGGNYKDDEGNPQILVIVNDNQEREASRFYTCGGKFAWSLARLCGAAGLDLDRMTKSGISPQKFADETFATKNLVGRQLWVSVKTTDNKGKSYTGFEPLRDDPDAQAPAGDDFGGGKSDDDIPI